MLKLKINLPLKLLVGGLIIVVALFFLISYAAQVLMALDYFKIKDIIYHRSERGPDLSYLMGRNIFSLNLEKESGRISGLCPDYKKISLIRLLPDKLCVVFTERIPLAYIKLYRYFYVDSELVLFDIPKGRGQADLPLIAGLEKKIVGVKSGKRYNIKELSVALNIIKEFGKSSLLKNYKIKRIDLSDPVNTNFFMVMPGQPSGQTQTQAPVVPGVLEVKIGQSGTNDRIRVLADVLTQLKKDLGNIKYIDLRFKEPVIRFNEGKS